MDPMDENGDSNQNGEIVNEWRLMGTQHLKVVKKIVDKISDTCLHDCLVIVANAGLWALEFQILQELVPCVYGKCL